MIQVFGAEGTREHDAAFALRELIAAGWAPAHDSAAYDIRIIAGAKCHGQRRRDIDLLLIAALGPGIGYEPFLQFTTDDGRLVLPSRVEMGSLFVVIELKDHAPEQVRFVGTAVEVCYQGNWKNASEQNHQQIYSVRNYVRSQSLREPWITSLVWLRNVPNTALPPRPHNILGASLTWDLFLNVVGQVAPSQSRTPCSRDEWRLDAFDRHASAPDRVAAVFTQMLVPTRLDRLRMERVNQRAADALHLERVVGRKLLILRGKGGTGKTVRLLQLARRLYDTEAARVLILTYNKALVADVRRQLALMDIPDDLAGSSIQVETAHSFFYAALSVLGLIPPGCSTFLEEFEQFKERGLALLREVAPSPVEVRALVPSSAGVFDWDYVFIDEGQDWPRNERELLVTFYSPERLAVADGVDQMVRSTTPANWRANLARSDYEVVSLSTCLRMKSCLGRFVAAFARGMGLHVDGMEPNLEAPGGRVIVLDGPYLADRSFHDSLLANNASDGNSPVDMLFCVPPNLIRRLSEDADAKSVPGRIFRDWGYSVWDGASEDARESYPTDVKQLRIVQFESCRGLEGWIAVHFQLDDFYDHKVKTFQQTPSGEAGILANNSERAHRHAAHWTMIPMTRAIDTLVVQIHQPYSRVRSALEASAAACADFIEWHTLP